MLYSHNWGAGDEPALLLHCSLASSDAWRGVATHLADELTMTAPDLPGHGNSEDWDGEGDYHKRCCDAVARFLTHPMHLVGHSFGATIALRLAIEQPDMVHSLTLIEPVFFAAAIGTAAYQQHEKEFQPFIDAMWRGDVIAATRIFTDLWGLKAEWERIPATRRDYLSARVGLIPASAPAIYEDNAEMLAEGQLERVSCPVLLMQGAQSPIIIPAINDALAARLSDVKRVQIKGAGHMLPVSHATEVAQEIDRFLEALRA